VKDPNMYSIKLYREVVSVSLQYKDDKWVVLYYYNHEPTFKRLSSKEDVMEFLAEQFEENTSMLNDYTVFPPKSDIVKEDIVAYGVPKAFL
jgi:hypothetical protein